MPGPRRRHAATAAAAALALALLQSPPAEASAPGAAGAGDPYFPLYGNGGYDALHYDLTVRYRPSTDVLVGDTTLTARATQDLSSFHLDLVGLTVRSLTVDGRSAGWTRSGRELVVTPRDVLVRGQTFSVRVRYDGVPRHVSSPTLGVYGFLPTPDGALVVGEPEVAAFWYPSDDHPSDKATYRITVSVPSGLRVLSNGLPGPTTESGGWATTSWRMNDPMASYLAFLAIGRFDVTRSTTPSGMPVIDAVDSSITGALRHRIDASVRREAEILAVEERWFGPYPFSSSGGVIDNIDIGFALENQSRPVHSPAFWQYPDRTLGDIVIVHELAHQWFGDSVALRRWRDIWLNEGFATYSEWLWQEREFGLTPQETFEEAYGSIPPDNEFWTVKIGDPGPGSLFVFPVYLRGAMTLQALRQQVGTESFFRILRTWTRNNRDGNGTTAGFQALAERISGRDLEQLFRAWVYTPGRPDLPGATRSTSSDRAAAVRAPVRQWMDGLRERVSRGRGSGATVGTGTESGGRR